MSFLLIEKSFAQALSQLLRLLYHMKKYMSSIILKKNSNLQAEKGVGYLKK